MRESKNVRRSVSGLDSSCTVNERRIRNVVSVGILALLACFHECISEENKKRI
jgi:hypothetical protein